MPVDRTLAQDLADTLVELYRELSARLAAALAAALGEDIDRDDWAARKLSGLRAHQRQAEALLAALDGQLGERVEQAVMLAHMRGSAAARAELERLTDVEAPDSPGGNAIQALVFALVSLLRGTHLRILRWDLDTYRDVVARASVDVLAGTSTRRRAAQVAWERLIADGVTGFVDKSGRRWELASYVEMATRSTVAQAAVQGHLDQLRASGEDLVMVSDSPQECALCRPWEGKVLAISGAGARTVEREHGIDDGRMVKVPVAGSVAEAVSRGLMHPNCTHSLSLYIPGVTKPLTNTANPQGDADRQRLRELERRLRRAKRRALAVIDPAARKPLNARVAHYQQQIRDHVADTGLIRQRPREQIGTAR